LILGASGKAKLARASQQQNIKPPNHSIHADRNQRGGACLPLLRLTLGGKFQ